MRKAHSSRYKISRRRFLLSTSAFVAAGMASPLVTRRAFAKSFPFPPGVVPLDPRKVLKFEVPLPDALSPGFKFASNASVGVHPLTQDLGLAGLAGQTTATTLYGYGAAGSPSDATYPGKTFEVFNGGAHTVTWSNELPPNTPHFLPVDNTIHTAWTEAGSPFVFPNQVPVVAHLHGGHTEGIYDGNPELAQMIVQGQSETFNYDTQEAATLWYHDHALGITRLNVYAGLAGFNIVRDQFDTGDPATNNPQLPCHPYEQLIVIQDRMFTDDFQLYYPSNPLTAAELFGDADYPNPTVMAEFFGDHILVNGQAWPVLDVEPRLYRLRFLNGCDTRFLNMGFAGLKFYVIGTDQGLLNAPVKVNRISIAPGERIDVLVDFSGESNKTYILGNNAPGTFRRPLIVDPQTTGRIMAFRVGFTITDNANNAVPLTLRGGTGQLPLLPPKPQLTYPLSPGPGPSGVDTIRQVVLYEEEDERGRLRPQLGTLVQPWLWSQPTTESIAFGDTEVWEIYNTTADAHPIHLHLVKFQIIDRQGINAEKFEEGGTTPPPLRGQPKPPAPEEDGWKDTVQVPSGTVTRIVATFDKVGQWVWHCHILSHEDHEMMRRFQVVS
jgi:spore coat protein A, manganese oxidase